MEGIVWCGDGSLRVVTMARGRFDATKVNYRSCRLLARHGPAPRSTAHWPALEPAQETGRKGAELIRCAWPACRRADTHTLPIGWRPSW